MTAHASTNRVNANTTRGNGSKRKEEQVDPAILDREEGRKIKLHDGDTEKAKSLDEAVVLITTGRKPRPDFRFAQNRKKFLADPSKRVNGEEDRRFLDNRPDIVEMKKQNGQNLSNYIFADD